MTTEKTGEKKTWVFFFFWVYLSGGEGGVKQSMRGEKKIMGKKKDSLVKVLA